jgi:hypothetical protein
MRHRHPGRPSILLVAVAAAVLAGSAPASAEVTIAVSPALLELDGSAGGRGDVEVTVSNNGDEPFEIVTAVEPLQDLVDDRSAVEWSSVEPSRLRLEPGEDRTARLTLAIPDDVASGGRYATVAFSTVAPGENAGTAVSGRILVPVLLTVEGRGDLTRLPVLERAALFLEADGTLGVRAQVRNDGNAHVPIAGDAEVAIPGTDRPGRMSVAMGRVLPGTTRVYAGDSSLTLPLGATYDVSLTLGVPADQEALGVPDIHRTFSASAIPELVLEDPRVCENADRGPTVTVGLDAEGDLGVVAAVRFEIRDAAGAPVPGAGASRAVLAWPMDATGVSADLTDPLPAGEYTLVTSAALGGGGAVETRLAFSVGGDPATAAPPCAPLPDPPPAH